MAWVFLVFVCVLRILISPIMLLILIACALVTTHPLRASVPCTYNPYESSTQEHYDWDNGHANESAGYHYADNYDLISAKQNGTTFICQ